MLVCSRVRLTKIHLRLDLSVSLPVQGTHQCGCDTGWTLWSWEYTLHVGWGKWRGGGWCQSKIVTEFAKRYLFYTQSVIHFLNLKLHNFLIIA